MESTTSLSLAEQVPRYVRWNPDRSPYAVELRLDLVSRISGELAQAERIGIEIGGMLLGTLPGGDSPTLRIDEVAMIGRRFEDGAIYMLDPGQQQRLTEIRESAKSRGRVAVGFFRSHLRPGPLQPSVADRTMLTDLLSQNVYIFLLIQSREPRTAAFFLTSGGQLPEQPSTRKFFFDDSEFKFLPEVLGQEIETRTKDFYEKPDDDEQQYRWLAVASIVSLALLLILGAFAGGIARLFRPSSNKIDLTVGSSGNVLQVSWDHSAPFILHAKSGVLSISDEQSRRDIRLGPDELKLGEIDYERRSKRVSFSMVLELPDSNLPPQTFDWTGN